ncbi:MAG: MBL fold metallo-hydrolase [Gemmatimonadetes bacterium]|nr:MBL fold metallo-hydrolase [Gemmatimonadota bacterium]
MLIRSVTVGPFQENTYLVADPEAREAVFIDPGDDAPRLLDALDATGCALRGIWITHAHVDHVGAVAAVKRRHDVPIAMHPADRPLYEHAVEQGRRFGIRMDAPPPPERDLAEDDTMTVGGLSFRVMHVPGHAPGHVAFVGHGVVFGGDCLFAGSIGRTDLPLCDPRALQRSLERLAALPPETVVYPGHGPTTTIGEEHRTNPFLTGVVRLIPR